MPVQGTNDTDGLLRQIADGDVSARDRLFQRHRSRLKEMIKIRMDRRLAARVDPSDVVQDSLAEADQKLEGYLRNRPLPFYPWLRQLALERMVHLHRVHVRAQRRSINREEPLASRRSDSSTPYSGAELAALCREAGLQAIRRGLARGLPPHRLVVSGQDLHHALKDLRDKRFPPESAPSSFGRSWLDLV